MRWSCRFVSAAPRRVALRLAAGEGFALLERLLLPAEDDAQRAAHLQLLIAALGSVQLGAADGGTSIDLVRRIIGAVRERALQVAAYAPEIGLAPPKGWPDWPTERAALQCWEKTNWLARAHPARICPSSRSFGSSFRRRLR